MGKTKRKWRGLLIGVLTLLFVLAAGSFAITKLLTIDHDYWHGWTLFEILRYAPQHNWSAYEEALKTNPVLAKMVISGVVYSVGDWIVHSATKGNLCLILIVHACSVLVCLVLRYMDPFTINSVRDIFDPAEQDMYQPCCECHTYRTRGD